MTIVVSILMLPLLLGGLYWLDSTKGFAIPAYPKAAPKVVPNQSPSLAEVIKTLEVNHELKSVPGAPTSYLGVSTKNKRLVLSNGQVARDLALTYLTGFDVRKDNVAITQTSRASQAAGTGVGALLLSPGGFIVGGVSGAKRTKERCSHGNHPIFKRPVSWTSRGKFQFHGGGDSADAHIGALIVV